jgi:hypothetical protein
MPRFSRADLLCWTRFGALKRPMGVRPNPAAEPAPGDDELNPFAS